MTKVLVAYDGSEMNKTALQEAKHLVHIKLMPTFLRHGFNMTLFREKEYDI